MKKRFIYVILPIITLILEIIPYGAVLNFGRPSETGEIGYFRELYSYFDMTPFGYANFAPLITGIFTCITLLRIIGYCISGKSTVAIVGRNLCIITAIINLCPLLYGVKYLSVVAVLVSISLVMEAWLLNKEIKKHTLEEN